VVKPAEGIAAGDPKANRLCRAEALALLAAVVLCRLVAWRAFPLYDAAFVALRCARNLALGAGLVFDPGEPWEPVLGTAAPAWAVLLAALARLGVDLPLAARVLGVACDGLLAAILLEVLDRRKLRSTVGLLAFAVLPPLARISLGGMEAPLFAVLAWSAVLSAARERSWRAGVLSGIASFVRPEGVVLALVLALARVRRMRELARLSGGALLVIAPGAALLWATYGSPVPQPVLARWAAHPAFSASEQWERIRTILVESFAGHPALLALLPVAGIGVHAALSWPGPARLYSAFSLALTGLFLATRPLLAGWHYHPALLAWIVWIALGAERVAAWIGNRLHGRIPEPGRVLSPVVLALVCVTLVFAGCALLPSAVETRVYAPLQSWAREVGRLHPGARILASDVGALGWGWEGTVLDSEGRTWPAALGYPHPNAMIADEQPEYLLLVAERARLAHFRAREDLRRRYVPVARFSVDGGRDLDPRPEDVSPVWVQDYIAYRRADL